MTLNKKKIFLEEFKNLGSSQEMASFIVENIPPDYKSGKIFVTRAAEYCGIESGTFRLIYRAQRKNIAVQNYRKLVIAWVKLKLSLENS